MGAVAAAALVLGAAWLWWPAGAQVDHEARAAGASASGAPAFWGTGFPWDPQLGAGMETGAASAALPISDDFEATRRKQRFGMALSVGSHKAPARPVWELLHSYAGPSVAGVGTDVELLAALSYCDLSSLVPRMLWEGRSQGTVPAADLEYMEARHAQATPLCARLSDRDYGLRVEILRFHARAGDTDAQLNFQYAGPTGRVGIEGHRSAIPDNGVPMSAWAREVVVYAKQAVLEEPLRGMMVLTSLYDPGPTIPANGTFAELSDPVEGHAYRILMVRMARNPQALSDFLARETSRLTPEQAAQAQIRADSIAQEIGPGLIARGKAVPEAPSSVPAPEATAAARQPTPSPFAAQ